MLEIFKKISFGNFKKLIQDIIRRFPLPALISVASFAIMVYIIRFSDTISQALEDNLLKTFITLVISFFFSVALYLYAESKRLEMSRKHYYQLVTFLFGFLFYYFFEEELFQSGQAETVVYIILTILGVVSFLFVSKYIQKFLIEIGSQNEFYVSSYTLIVKILMSAIVGVVTMLLGFIAITSVFTLFDIEFLEDDNWYGYWAVFSLVIFAPYFFLANVPRVELAEIGSIEEVSANKFYSFLINYVGLPAISIYFIILYAYTIKVLINFTEWPHGEVAWMVILFSFFGYLVYFASFAFRERFKTAKIFRKILPVAVLLQTPMLFYAIGLRINQYDITINRYLVLVFGLWLLFLSVYYISSKKKDLSMSFYSLLVVVILMSIGPWSVYVVPEWRQFNVLEKNLTESGILQGAKIVPLKSYRDIDAKLSGQIYGEIQYLCNFHGCKTLDKLFFKEIEEIKKKEKEEFEENKIKRLKDARNRNSEEQIRRVEDDEYDGISNWKLVKELSELIKVERYDSFYNNREEPEYLRFENDRRYDYFDTNIDIGGFDKMVRLSPSDDRRILNDIEMGLYFVTINTDDSKLRLVLGKEVLEDIDIGESIISKILNSEESAEEPEKRDPSIRAMLSNKDMTFDIGGKKFDMRVMIKTISIKNPDWSEEDNVIDGAENERLRMPISFSSSLAEGYVLLREKIEISE